MNLDAPVALKDGQNGQNGDQHVENEEGEEEEDDSDFDTTGFTSDDDGEVREIRTKYKEFNAQARKRGDIPLDTPFTLEIPEGSVWFWDDVGWVGVDLSHVWMSGLEPTQFLFG